MAGERLFTSLGARSIDLDVAWNDRLVDADHLMAAGRYPAAISTGIYALEILLKARICRFLKLNRLPKPLEIHDLEGLMVMSGLKSNLNKKPARPVKHNWTTIIKTFAPNHHELRYLSNNAKSWQEAEEFFVLLKHQTNGVIPWITRQA